jgi:hypothetical protein
MTSEQFGKAVVVAVEPYRQPASDYWRPAAPVKTTKGPGVLVDLFGADRHGDLMANPVRQVVSLAALHGPYAEARTTVERHLRAAKAVVDTHMKLRAETADHARGLVERATQLGVRVTSHESPFAGHTVAPTRFIQVSLDEFERLLQRLESGQ